MSKYIIDIPDNVKKIVYFHLGNANAVWTTSNDLDDLEQLNSDYINEHFGDLQDTAYQKGINDAWEAARKLFSSMADSDIEKAFPTEWNNGGFNALINLQPQEAIEKLKAYEEKQLDKIKRGDIVNVKGCCNDNLLGVVTKVWEDNCYIMWGDGSGGAWSKDSVFKTGKHADIDKIFEEIAT